MSEQEIIELQEVADNTKQFLSDTELMSINNLTYDRKIINLESQLIAQRIENKKKDIQILEKQIEILRRDINEFSGQISNKSNLDNNIKKQYAELIKNLAGKYNLPERWGINPETGEISVD